MSFVPRPRNNSQPNTGALCKAKSRQKLSALLNHRACTRGLALPGLMTQAAFVWLGRNVPRGIRSRRGGPGSSPYGCRVEQSSLFSPSRQTLLLNFTTGGFSFVFQAAQSPSCFQNRATVGCTHQAGLLSYFLLTSQHKAPSSI